MLSRRIGTRVVPAGVLAGAVAAALIGGCAPESTLPKGSSVIKVTEGQRDGQVAVGGVLHVDLPGVSGTGYEWRLSGAVPPFLEVVGKPHVTPLDPGVLGGRTMTVFQFKALAAGEGTLSFETIRPWEKDGQPGKTAAVSVVAK